MIDEKIFNTWADIDETGQAGTPWGIRTLDLLKTGLEVAEAVDRVILFHLKNGEAAPLARLFALGIAPGPKILSYIGGMMSPELVPADYQAKHIRFGLVIKDIDEAEAKRPRSRIHGKKHPFHALRDELIVGNVRNLSTKMKQDAAIATIAELSGIEEQTVRNALKADNKKRRSRKTQGK